jgi:glucose/arabinose dehydrogenase
MLSRAMKVLCASVVVCAGFGAVATAAGPPPPVSTNGHKVTLVATGVQTPTSFAFAGGNVFEGDGGNSTSENAPPTGGGVYLLKHGTATRLSGSPDFVGGLAWRGNTLYVSAESFSASGLKAQILAWSGWNGTTFTSQKVLYTPPKKFNGFNGLGFGHDGRLYVGVDVGFTDGNDHGSARTSPFVYDILSMDTHGKHVKVFASGMRQPWQMAFPNGSSSPFVSDLGQDAPTKTADKAPDFILRVKQGDNYGFPKCNWINLTPCKHFTKPSFRKFGPHTDAMGLAIVGNRLYFSSFTGLKAKGQGQIASVPLHGHGSVKVLLSSLVAPIVGLGVHNGTLYVGELTGNVYSIKP